MTAINPALSTYSQTHRTDVDSFLTTLDKAQRTMTVQLEDIADKAFLLLTDMQHRMDELSDAIKAAPTLPDNWEVALCARQDEIEAVTAIYGYARAMAHQINNRAIEWPANRDALIQFHGAGGVI